MKIGLFLALFGDRGLPEALDAAKAAGVQAVEIGAGAYPGSSHLDAGRLLNDEEARRVWLDEIASRGLALSAISVHGNPLHPDRGIAQAHHDAFRTAVQLAPLLGIDRVNGFSGCPGDGPDAKNPNWVTCAWPDEFRDILDWQWREAVVPYWRDQAAFLSEHRVRFCIEMHPGFVVYSNETLLRLRREVGEHGKWIGANFDPSHLWWQGIDPLVAARELGLAGALFHVHAKDTRVEPANALRNGNLDTKSYGDVLNRSWVFRSVGYGHGVDWWREFVTVLRTVGYDDVLSIEHEDSLMSTGEGLAKAVDTLRQAVVSEASGPMFWARD
ncbi:MAG: sugar phosphate isomerase/epimerase [Fimbriimonadaceae bacterium]|nr:sugar phosphate isomerase/epimerase [Fimbriimonadaceae bacterium]QYK54905.1 MAG: sugar phosphate isomerase/epimerase [Fimbriimonadaceae bacterium]